MFSHTKNYLLSIVVSCIVVFLVVFERGNAVELLKNSVINTTFEISLDEFKSALFVMLIVALIMIFDILIDKISGFDSDFMDLTERVSIQTISLLASGFNLIYLTDSEYRAYVFCVSSTARLIFSVFALANVLHKVDSSTFSVTFVFLFQFLSGGAGILSISGIGYRSDSASNILSYTLVLASSVYLSFFFIRWIIKSKLLHKKVADILIADIYALLYGSTSVILIGNLFVCGIRNLGTWNENDHINISLFIYSGAFFSFATGSIPGTWPCCVFLLLNFFLLSNVCVNAD